MIVEQAFFSLPEYLVGTGFTRYVSEGTLVMSYAMAVLQELNGRNVNNPVALISGEKGYPDAPSRKADLYVNSNPVGVLNERLNQFGVRREAWVEAKFFRKQDGSPTCDKTSATYDVLRDLLRLSLFPPLIVGKAPEAGRYFVHVYEGAALDHLALQRNPPAGGKREDRGWLSNLFTSGCQRIVAGDLSREPATFDQEIGRTLRSMSAEFTVTTFSLGSSQSPYTLYLTRIDEFDIHLENDSVSVTYDGCTESTGDAVVRLRQSLNEGLTK